MWSQLIDAKSWNRQSWLCGSRTQVDLQATKNCASNSSGGWWTSIWTYGDIHGNKERWRSARLKRKISRVQPKVFLVVLNFRAEQVFIKAESRREKWERFLEGIGWWDCFKILFNKISKIICWLRCTNISEKAQYSWVVRFSVIHRCTCSKVRFEAILEVCRLLGHDPNHTLNIL